MAKRSLEEHLYDSFITFKGANLTAEEIEELILNTEELKDKITRKAASELQIDIPLNAMDSCSGPDWSAFKQSLYETYGKQEDT